MTTAPPQARLIVLATGRVFPLTALVTTVGRESPKRRGTGPDVVPLPDMNMSTHHAFIYHQQGTFTVQDGNSLNGTI